MRFHRLIAASAVLLVACNAILGFDEPTLRQAGSVETPEEAGIGSDAQAPTEGGPAADSGDAGSNVEVEAGPFPCNSIPSLALRPLASAGGTMNGPDLAYASPNLFGVTWASSASEIRFNSTSSSGPVAAEGGFVVENGNSYGSYPRVAWAGSTFLVAVGASSGPATSFVRAVQVGSGGTIMNATSSPSTFDAGVEPNVAIASGDSKVPLVARRASSFNETTGFITRVNASTQFSGTAVQSAAARAVGVAWLVPGTSFVAVGLDNDGLQISRHADDGAVQAGPTEILMEHAGQFSLALDLPDVAVAALDPTAVVVAWVGVNTANERQLFLTTVNVQSTITRKNTVSVSALDQKIKVMPRLAFDGKSIAIAWLEESSPPGSYEMKLRRFDANLGQRDVDAIKPVPKKLPMTTFGLTRADQQNNYALAFIAEDGVRYFGLVDCSGPP